MTSINKILLTSLLSFFGLCINAQGLTKSDIEIKAGNSPHQGRFVVNFVKNNYKEDVVIRFTNEYGTGGPVTINVKQGEPRKIDITCNVVEARPLSGGNFVDLIRKPKPKDIAKTGEQRENSKVAKSAVMKKNGLLTMEEVVSGFNNYLDSIPFLSLASIEMETAIVGEHINSVRNWKDKEAYISEHHLYSYINLIRDSLYQYSKDTSLITNYIETIDRKKIADKNECLDSLQVVLTNRLGLREANMNRLSDELNAEPETMPFDWKKLDRKWIGAGILILIIILFGIRKASKKHRTTSLSGNDSNGGADASSAIVVRRKTTSILRKQSLEDVIDNDAYIRIDCDDFCSDSAVRRMYIKNTCIKDIYNMYAEDLRNPNNPKEDGCMVLGRWVHDDQSNEYYVSLEHIVLPGDDAVFSEYELNFGGKIKLKVTDKLRKLRRETNLQYDLTCWVHSHPGLGVFFSNSDSNVQMQLKHPTHPNFLTAIVVDILTPRQDMGIFTFKRDSTLNSKNDLKKMYSLEELYEWAVESDRNSFKPEDHYNTLADAKSHQDECYGIELSNGAIIDMGMLVAEKNTGLVGMVHGFSNRQGLKTEHVASTVSKNEAVPDNELIGCFIIATHCSIPSIRKVIASYTGKIQFVLVYTTTDGLLTSIPVINQDVCIDENFYGELKFEDLKIWTRRKR